MLKKRLFLFTWVLLCAGQAGVSAWADEPKTGANRDTLLYVKTDPPGAKVSLNGKELGTSNGLFTVESGNGKLVISVEGRKQIEKDVVIQVSSVNRVEVSLEPKAVAEDAHFIANLPKGTIEVVGVTDYPPTEKSSWWRADGASVSLGPITLDRPQWSLSADKAPICILLRLKDIPAGASHPAWRMTPSTGNWGSPAVRPPFPEATAKEYCLFAGELGTKTEPVSLRVGISAGKWETVITQDAANLGESKFSRDGEEVTVKFLEAVAASSGETRVRLTKTDSYGKLYTRLLAVTDDGCTYPSLIGYYGDQGTATFRNVPLESIKEYRLQVRPYDWIEFKNIASQPGQKTDVQAVSSGEAK